VRTGHPPRSKGHRTLFESPSPSRRRRITQIESRRPEATKDHEDAPQNKNVRSK
jgi:hypothetical protein